MSRISYIEDMEKWREEFIFKQKINVRFSETDMFGHVNNTVPFIYFEEGRLEYFKSVGLMDEWVTSHSDGMIVTADIQCDYIQQVFFGETLEVYVKAGKIGNSSVDLHYMITKENGSICYTGRGAMVQVSKNTGKALPWSNSIKEKFAQVKQKV